MVTSLRSARYRRHAMAVLSIAALTMPVVVFAAPEYLRYYSSGLTAADEGRWQQVEELMGQAIERRPSERRRRLIRSTGYYPHFYLGLARYHMEDCPGALAAWAESERQSAIVGTDEFSDLLRYRADCEEDGRPSPSAMASAAGESPSDAQVGSSGRETVRTAQHMVERGADPTRKTLGALGEVAPDGSRLDEAAERGVTAVDLAEQATEVVDVALSPSQRLEAAIDAYFVGKPLETLRQLQGIDIGDPRARAQVHLFRAAANFRLHVLAGSDPARLEAARESADLFRQERWRTDFPSDLFDPRFVRFLRGGG